MRGREVVDNGKEGEAMGQFGRVTAQSDLPGAREEAGAVRDLLRGHVPAADVVDLIDAKAADIVAALHRRPWRVLHLAGLSRLAA